MDLNIVRSRLEKTLAAHNLTQDAFARRHDLSSSWLNKFMCGHITNPQLKSLERLQKALDAEVLRAA
jgi:transcriptional regulator with XRE-family HTH domain